MLPSVSHYCILFNETILRTPKEHYQADFAENTRCSFMRAFTVPQVKKFCLCVCIVKALKRSTFGLESS